MVYKELTQNHFEEFKQDYSVYGTTTVEDEYGNEQLVKNDEPKATLHVMWQPMTDWAHVAEYGRDVERMFYCILYDDTADLSYGDVVVIRGDEYEVMGLKYFNTYTRVDVRKKV